MTVQFRVFDNGVKSRQQKLHDIDARVDDKNGSDRPPEFWCFRFPLEISALSATLGAGSKSISHVPKILTPIISKLSFIIMNIGEFLGEQYKTSSCLNSRSFSSSFLRQVSKTLSAQSRGMTEGFKNNGLPWTGHECRSIMAGGSGVLYCLPALFCKNNHAEECVWLTQAFLSVMADYVYVDRDSWFHGIDRFFATANTLAVIIRAALGLKITTAMIAIIPLATFALANRSKQQLNIQSWIYYHFLWHLTSSIGVAFAINLLYNCPDYELYPPTERHQLSRFCSNES